MGYERTLRTPRWAGCGRTAGGVAAAPARLAAREECLRQLLEAFHDLADRDDIHQAASRLDLVQQWIRDEAERAAGDPIFADLALRS